MHSDGCGNGSKYDPNGSPCTRCVRNAGHDPPRERIIHSRNLGGRTLTKIRDAQRINSTMLINSTRMVLVKGQFAARISMLAP